MTRSNGFMKSLLLVCLATFPMVARGATSEFRVLFDVDNNTATGCVVNGMLGVDQTLVTRVTDTDTSASVTQTHRQLCVGGLLGAPVDVNTSGWPAGWQPASGHMLVETRVPFSAFGSGMPSPMRIAFTGTRGALSYTVLLQSNGDPMMVPPGPGGRRHAVGHPGPVRVITMDGHDSDWYGIPPLSPGSAGGGASDLKLIQAFAFADPNDSFLYFNFNVNVSGLGILAVNDTYTRLQGAATLTQPAPGVLGNDVANDGPLTAVTVGIPDNGSVALNADGSFTYTPNDPSSVATDSFNYKAVVGDEESNVAKVSIQVEHVDEEPAFTSANGVQLQAGVAANFTVTTSGVPEPSITLTGALPAGVTFSDNGNGTGTISGTPTNGSGGTYPVILTASNTAGTATQNFTIVVCNNIVVTNPATSTGTADAAFSETFTQTGAVGTATFTINSGVLPAGLTLATNGTLSGTPTVTGSFPITVRVTDGNGCTNVGATYNLVINCQTITVTNPGTTTGTAGTAFSQTFTQTGAIGSATFTTASTLPAGLTLATNGTLSGTPTQTGTFPIVVTVTDSNGCTGTSATYSLVIGCQTITVTNPATTTGTAGTAFSQTFTQTAAIGGATFTTASTLPTGLTLATNGTLSGTPTQIGTFPIVVTVTDGNGCTGTGATYSLVINCQTITVTNPATTTATVGTAFSQTFTQTSAIGTATFTTASTLPTGFTLATNGTLSGTTTQFGSFPIVVTVTDSNGCTGTGATYNLVVNCQTITVTNPGVTNGTAGTPFSQTFTETGSLGGATFTTASTLPAGLTLATNGTLSGTPTQTGSFPIVVTVTDGNGCTGTSATYTLVIACQTITVTNPVNTNGTASSAFSETFTQTSAIGGATFTTASTLPTGLSLATNGTLSGTPTQTGSFPIVVTVTDSNGCTGTGATYTLVIACQTITVTNPATTTGTVSAPFSQTFTQTGAIGTATFTTASTLPAGLSLATNGTLSGTPTEDGSFPIVVTVTDSNGCTGTSATYNLVIACQVITVTNPVNTNGTVSAPFSETFTQTSAVGGATFTTASTLPAGLTLATNGVLSGTPTQAGSFPIVVTVTDGNGCTGTSATYNLVIACQVITVTNPANATGPAGTPFSETFTQTGAIGTATFTTASTLPTGLSLSTAGVLSGTPTQGGTFPIVVTVTDSNVCTGTSATYTLIITCPVITVTNPVNAAGTAGTPFSETFTQAGGQGTITFTLATGTLPTGLTLATNGTLSGTPTQTGSFPITVTATDQNGCVGTGATYTLVISCQTITVTNPVITTGVAGAAFSQTFTQTSAIGGATFTLNSGTLPAGLSLATNGTLSGTPTQTGAFPITVLVTDGNGCTGVSATYNLTITCQTITVTNPATTTGTVNAAFSQTFTQVGAIGSATFTTASTLPAGLTLSTAGVLSGTPSEDGTFPIVVTVTDSNGCTGTSATYNLVIACQTITVTNPVNTNGTVGSPFSETFTQTGALGGATFTTASTLPAGLTLSTAGVLSGTPTQSGSFPIVVTVTDGQNSCTGTSATYNLVIACQVITVTNPGVTTGTVDAAFSQTFTQTGAVGTATFTTASTLPSGLTLSTAGVLSGTPGQPGSFPITVLVTDSNGCTGTSAVYTLVIACQTITVTNPGVTTGTVDSLFSQTFTQTGVGTHTPATFTTSSTLPSGLTLSSAGVLSGTPGQPGTFPIVVTVTDVNGCTGTSATYTMVIACQTITVTNPGVTTATYNQAFSQTFTQTGVGTHTPATFTTSSTLPTGLSLSTAGVLSGTPTQTGTFPITVTVTDANSCTGTSSTYTLSVAPVASNDAINGGVDNTQLVLTGGTTGTPSTPSVQVAGTIKVNDLPSAATVTVVAFGPSATTAGGSVTVAADGTFLYTPPVNSAAAAITNDTFTYTVTSNTGGTGPVTSAPGTVTINLVDRVWYVKNDAAGGGNGQSHSPFNTLVAAQTASTAGDFIYVYSGNGTTSGQNAGIALKSNQKLHGQGIALIVNGSTLVAAVTQPLIDNTTVGGSGVTMTNVVGVTVRGLSIAGNTNAIDITTSAASTGTTTIANNTIRSAGAEGIDVNLNAGTTGIHTLAITNNTWGAGPHTGNAVDVSNVSGSGDTLRLNFSGNTNLTSGGAGVLINGGAVANTTITGFADNSIDGNTVGTGVSITNVTFDSTAGGAIQQVDGNNLAIGASGNPVGVSGMLVTTSQGNLYFDDLDIFSATGTGLGASGTGSGLTFSVLAAPPDNTGSSTIDEDSGPAIDLNTVTIDLRLAGLQSNTSTTGLTFVGVGGQFRAPTGSQITKASGGGTAFSVGTSSATVTYAGTLNVTSGAGVSLTTNSGSVAFSGGMTLSTGTSTAFNATGGGTVTVTDPPGVTNNTITTTTGTAVNIATPSIIGGAGITFERITTDNGVSNSATNAIVLNGTTGSFTVTGDGSQTGGFYDRDGSGGVIDRTTGHSVVLTNASNVTLRQMDITNTATNFDGINSSGGSNVIVSAMNFDTLGNHGWSAVNLGGVNRVDHNSRFFSWNTINSNAVVVTNTSTNFTSFTFDRSLMTTSATGAPGFSFIMNGTTTGGTVTVSNSEFTLIDQNAVQILANGSGTNTAIVQKNNFHDADATSGDGNNTLFLSNAGSGVFNFTVGGPVAATDGNTFTNLARLTSTAAIIDVNAVTTSQTGTRLVGTIQNNTITNSIARRGIGFGIEANGGAHGGHDIIVDNNILNTIQSQGIMFNINSVNGGDVTGNGIQITNNQLTNVGIGGGDAGSGIEIENNSAAAGGNFSWDVLIQGNQVSNNNNSALGSTLELVSRSLFAGDTSTMNYNLRGNTLTNANAAGEVFEALNSGTAGTLTVCMDINGANVPANFNSFNGGAGMVKVTNNFGNINVGGMGAGAQPAGTVQTFITARNTFLSGATVVAGGAVGTFSGSPGGCTLP